MTPLNVTNIVKLQTRACRYMSNEPTDGAKAYESKPNLLLNIKFNLGFMLYITETCLLWKQFYNSAIYGNYLYFSYEYFT